MESDSDANKEPSDKRTARIVDPSSSAGQTQRKKLGSILNFEKHERANDDFHPKVLKNFHQKHQGERKCHNSEEVVKYMSNLPSFLEKGENRQDKAFNLGVLDWRLLENWQHMSRQTFPGTRAQEFKTDGLVTSSKGKDSTFRGKDREKAEVQNSATDHDPFERHKTAKPRQAASLGNRHFVQGHSSYSSKGENRRSLEENRYSYFGECSATVHRTNFISLSDESGKTKDSLSDERCSEEKNCPSDVISRTSFPGSSSSSPSGLPSKIPVDEFSQVKMSIPESKGNGSTPNSPSRRKKWKENASDSSLSDLAEENFSRLKMAISVSAEANVSISTNPYRRKSLEGKMSVSLPKNLAENGFPRLKAGVSESAKANGSVSVSPSKGKNRKEKIYDDLLGNLAEDGSCRSKIGISESAKVRNPSPNRRFGFGLGRRGKSSSSAVTSVEPYSVSENAAGSKLSSSSACTSASTCDKSQATSRARSSPLRRLLDPFLKPKGVEPHHSAKSVEKNTSKVNNAKSSQELDLKGSRTNNISRLRQSESTGSPTMQALLQVTVKNGLPLFTFTVDNCGEILAATVKELTSPKKPLQRRWVYTFFSFSEMKKKNMHWINQGCKDRTQGFVSNVIAQMKVSDVPCTDSNRQTSVKKFTTREFVLSSMGTNNGDQALDGVPSDELAAIVVKFSDKLTQDLKEPLQEVHSSVSNDGCLSMTVILPGGDHGAPRKGDPSPLIKRWKTGGSCDCGGWDLGCQLRVLACSNQSSLRFNPVKAQESIFKLFSQEEAEENKPAFVLSPFEDEIFSVEFSSSLKLIQAFGVGIGFLNSKASIALPPNTVGGKIAEENTLSKGTLPRNVVEVPAKYVSYPPLSPVGRV